ncbi:MAG: ATP-binding protein, partial [Psychrosphaera sp.]|nr:ATP-binding protein [Psychrosphaera sp.]
RAKAVSRDSDGTAQRIVGTVEDIDELKQVQTELKKLNTELESRVKARTLELTDTLEKLHSTEIQLIESEKLASLAELVVGIAHELNTPLGISLTATTHIHDILKTLCDKKSRRKMSAADFDQFESTALDGLMLLFDNINKTIELVQTFKSLSPKTTEESGSSFSLSKLLNCFAQVNNNRNENPQAKLTINCPAKLTITTFANDLIDILLQLLNNAYTHGFIDINQPTILIEVINTDTGITLQFKDNGVGIDQDLLKKIFEPFYTTKRGTRTGLGLPIVYNIVYYRLSGTLTCDSKPGHGFSLNIHLPISSNKLLIHSQ